MNVPELEFKEEKLYYSSRNYESLFLVFVKIDIISIIIISRYIDVLVIIT